MSTYGSEYDGRYSSINRRENYDTHDVATSPPSKETKIWVKTQMNIYLFLAKWNQEETQSSLHSKTIFSR